ncbi:MULTISPECIES: phage tail protein, partial [unclassified Myroides]|uniref:phage tail protein n=1 Tax=unclassified Myroides TaxID=2642485 RepID=UPI003D2F7D6E
MKYSIKRNNQVIATVAPTGSVSRKIMAEELVNMKFILPKYIPFQIGDTVEVYGDTYVLNKEPNAQKNATNHFVYELQFESFKYNLNKVLFLGFNQNNDLTETEFAIMGNAEVLLRHIVTNANREGGNWKLGYAEETESKNIAFNDNNVLSALSLCADEFETEYWIDGDKTIHLIKKQEVSRLELEYGQSKGLRTISRTTLDSSNILTRLYASGSSRNIPPSYRYGSSRLKLDVPYLENNVNKFGLIEASHTWDEIYPRRNGKITAVFSDNPFKFVDTSMDFDLNGTTELNGEITPILLPGIAAKVTFNTGQLAGYTFEIQKHGYNHQAKSFVLLKNKDEKAYEVPNELLRPAVGDVYVLTDIVMPEAYLINAETELKNKAQEYLEENSIPRLQYLAQGDPIYFERQNINLQLGNTIRFKDVDFGLDAEIRVISIVKDLQNPFQVEFEIAEKIQQEKIIRDYIDKNRKEQELIDNRKKFTESIMRNYEFSQEIQENVFDAEGYFDPVKIKPLSIETKMLAVGSREQQFTLEDLTLMIEANNTALRNTKGQIIHYTLEEEPRYWDIPANTFNGISTGFNFIYIKAQKVGNNASVFVSPNQIKVDADEAFYHFEAGYLSSVSNGFRKIRLSNGFTNINGREITTGRITSTDGNTYFDLDTGEIRGKITFSSDSPALEEIENIIQDQEIYVEYSVNGTSAWHSTMQSTDVYMRQRKGTNPWGQAVRIAGKDGLKGDQGIQGVKGDRGLQGIQGNKGDQGIQGIQGVKGDRGLQGLQGNKGDQGIAGAKGIDGQTSYTHIAYADTATGGGFSQNPTGKTYIGMYVDFIAQDSTVASKYKWSLIKGADGNQGIPGAKGADGKTPYFHTAWANNITGTSGFSTTISVGKTHIGTYTDFTQADSSDPTKYKWSQIKGDKGDKGDRGLQGLQGNKGDQGIAGAKGIDGQTSYTHIAYADTAT